MRKAKGCKLSVLLQLDACLGLFFWLSARGIDLPAYDASTDELR